MKVYDESGALLAEIPDLTKGELRVEKRLAAHHPATEGTPAVQHLEPMEGAPELRHWVTDKPAVPAQGAWDEYEDVQVYRLYTPEELAERNRPTLEQRVEVAEAALLEVMLKQGGVARV